MADKYETIRLSVTEGNGHFRVTMESPEDGLLLLGYDDWCGDMREWTRREEIRFPMDWAESVAKNLLRLRDFERMREGE